MFAPDVRAPILAFFLISLGGLILHLRIHPPGESVFFLLPSLVAALNVLVLPLLYAWPALAPAAFLLTAATVAIGTLGMSYFSAVTWLGPLDPWSLISKSTVPDILVLMAKLPLGWIILARQRPRIQVREGRCRP